MKKKTGAVAAAAFLLVSVAFCAGTLAAGPDPAKVTDVLKGGGGAVGGIGFMVLTGMSKVVKDVYPKLDITVVPGGWVGNLYRVQSGELDIGSTTTAMCALAEAKTDPFEKPVPDVKALYCTQDKLYYFLIVKKEAPFDSLREMFEKKPPVRLCTLNKGTTTELMWRNVFASQGVAWEDLSKWGGKVNFVAWADAVNLIKDGHADGILAVGTQQMGPMMELSHARDMKIAKWDQELLDGLHKRFGFGTGTIPANTYPKITEAVVCPTDSGEIIVRSSVSDTTVEAILTALADNAKQYASYHAALADFTAEGMAASLKLPLHPTAEKFYKSRNIPIP